MNETDRPDDALDALLRITAPDPLSDDGFVARTLAAVDRATPQVRAAPVASPREIARALVAERRRVARLARLRHWGLAGVAAGVLLVGLAVLAAPVGAGLAAITADSPVVATLWVALLAGTGWLGWQGLRAA